jgi:hypothetical protein
MWLGFSIESFWKFANEQRVQLDDAEAISDIIDRRKTKVDIWVRLDNRYDQLENTFKGPIFYNHIELTLSVSKKGKDSLDQFQNMFPEASALLKRGDY